MSGKRYLPFIILIGGLAISSSGCRTNCGSCSPPPYYQPLLNRQPTFQQQPNFQQQQPFFNQQQFQNQQGFGSVPASTPAFGSGSLSRSQLIPPPATGSLTIPSLARNNPFGVNQNRGLLNTNQAAPTDATRSARFNAQNGWHGIEGALLNGQSPQTTQPAGSTTLGNNTTPNSPTTLPANAASVLVADTQARSDRGYGDSYVRSPNYATTTINETQDGTRLPATDASAVRAPSQYYARATGVQQVAQVPQQAYAGAAQPYYSGTFRTAQQVGVQQNGIFAANPNAVVLDQGTATYDPYGDTRSADWRNRDITSGNFQ